MLTVTASLDVETLVTHFVSRTCCSLESCSVGHADEPIPVHVTGNMWGQTWSNIYDLVVPYPNRTNIDVTPQLISQNYNPSSMMTVGYCSKFTRDDIQ